MITDKTDGAANRIANTQLSNVSNKSSEPTESGVKKSSVASEAQSLSSPSSSSMLGELNLKSLTKAGELKNSLVLAVKQSSSAQLQKAAVQPDSKAKGALFVKALTKPGTNETGIITKGNVAPEVDVSAKRFAFPEPGVYQVKDGKITNELGLGKVFSLDRPGMYLGGKVGGKEVDAGLAWNPVTISVKNGENTAKILTYTTDFDGSSPDKQYTIRRNGDVAVVKRVENGKETNIVATASSIRVNENNSVTLIDKSDFPPKIITLYPNSAFTPYFRSENNPSGNKGGYADYPNATQNGQNIYIYPKDKFDMSLTIDDKTGVATFSLSSGGKTTTHSDKVGKVPDPILLPSGTVVKPPLSIELKRVDSIDQKVNPKTDPATGKKTYFDKGNEGNNALETTTKVSGGSWGKSDLILTDGKTISFNSDIFDRIVSDEMKPTFESVNSQDGKGRYTAADGSEPVYINGGKYKMK